MPPFYTQLMACMDIVYNSVIENIENANKKRRSLERVLSPSLFSLHLANTTGLASWKETVLMCLYLRKKNELNDGLRTKLGFYWEIMSINNVQHSIFFLLMLLLLLLLMKEQLISCKISLPILFRIQLMLYYGHDAIAVVGSSLFNNRSCFV